MKEDSNEVQEEGEPDLSVSMTVEVFGPLLSQEIVDELAMKLNEFMMQYGQNKNISLTMIGKARGVEPCGATLGCDCDNCIALRSDDGQDGDDTADDEDEDSPIPAAMARYLNSRRN